MLAANGIPEAEAEKLAGEWISMRPGDSYEKGYLTYANGIHGMTLASQADALRVIAPLTRTGAMTVDGRAVYGVSGEATDYYSITVNGQKVSPTETVDIAATGAPLPVSVSSHSNGTGTTCDFSDRNEPLNLAAPAPAVPITSIPAG